jgi:trigger factor
VQVQDSAVDQALSQLRERAARYEPIENRGVELGDSVLMDLVRTTAKKTEEPLIVIPGQEPPRETETDKHDNVTVDIGAAANPPGFDEALIGLSAGDQKSFDVVYPEDYAIKELAGTTVRYDVSTKAIRKRVVPDLDDEFAKDLGEFDSLAALTTRVRADLEHEAAHEAEREMRADLLKQLSSRVSFDVPASLLDREVDRRVEEFVRRLMEQQVDPMQTNINWEEFRERQKEGAAEAVRSALVLDEIARREAITVPESEIEAEVARYAERSGRTSAAVRARLEKEGGLGRLYTALRREKTIAFLLTRATTTE